ncbi:hypothetical protein IAU60_006576 [Kwoniella sp. DSM 27419]
MSGTNEPTALSDPVAYLALNKFNRRLARCPRTNLPVTFSDIGDAAGEAMVYLLPSGCSRWIAASMDPLAKAYGIRMIVVDRPGCGGTGQVPLGERIERSCEMVVSVLEYLGLKPAHILASSAGIYYTLHLLTRHPSAFASGLDPPPRVYLIAPWSPLLHPEHPDYWPFKWDWIPSGLIATQHITTPHLIRAAENAQKAYGISTKALSTGRSLAMKWFKTLTEPEPQHEPPTQLAPRPELDRRSAEGIPHATPATPPARSERDPRPRLDTASSNASIIGLHRLSLDSDGPGVGANAGQEGSPVPKAKGPDLGRIPNLTPLSDEAQDRTRALSASELLSNVRGGSKSIGEGTDVPHPGETVVQDGEEVPKRLWGPCECCVSCTQSTDGYMTAENNQGIGQEHLICLNRGPEDTGAQWLENAASDLAATVEFAQSTAIASKPEGTATLSPVEIDVWWGWLDDMVPRKGQLWFNKVLGGHPKTITLRVHDVEDGTHTDLLSRAEGLHQVFAMVNPSHGGGTQ